MTNKTRTKLNQFLQQFDKIVEHLDSIDDNESTELANILLQLKIGAEDAISYFSSLEARRDEREKHGSQYAPKEES